MSHLTKAIFWLVCSLLLLFCHIIDVILQNWSLAIFCGTIFVLDVTNTIIEFSAWAREKKRKETQKQKNNEKDT